MYKEPTKETDIYVLFADYMEKNHPTIILHFDSGSGTRLPYGITNKIKKYNKVRGFPDLNVMHSTASFNGFYCEIKLASEYVYYVRGPEKGLLKADEHIHEQNWWLEKLRLQGYYAEFAVGINDLIQKWEEYFSDTTV